MLVLVIGLPGSGKSHYLVNHPFPIKYDDFLFDFWNGKFLSSLQEGDVIAADPRLCCPKTLKWFLSVIPNIKIKLVLFENDYKQCMINKPERRVDIDKFSQIYDDNIMFDNIEIDRIKVFR